MSANIPSGGSSYSLTRGIGEYFVRIPIKIGGKIIAIKNNYREEIILISQVIIALALVIFNIPFAECILGFASGSFFSEILMRTSSKWNMKPLKICLLSLKKLNSNYPRNTAITALFSLVLWSRYREAAFVFGVICGFFTTFKYSQQKLEKIIRDNVQMV